MTELVQSKYDNKWRLWKEVKSSETAMQWVCIGVYDYLIDWE